ncbi:MAG: hypothetical protein EBT18_11770, partial [Gammaproteobacteria bacterium]|nr:hypothetical protein [Gammaproteobacteria bacterium]
MSKHWANLQPLKYIETIPGETYGGSISVKANSGLIGKVIHSRAYYDLYAFYCPIRLLWSDFPKFLASSEGEVKPPTVATLMPENFENSFTNAEAQNAAFLRRMYYMVYYTFFAFSHGEAKTRASELAHDIREGDHDTENALKYCYARPSTFDNAWLQESDVQAQMIKGVVNGSRAETPLDEIRRAYALDRWEKMRDY